MVLKDYLVLIPGIILAFILYSLSQGFNNIIGTELLGYSKSPISTAMIAILLGIFFGNFLAVKTIAYSRERNKVLLKSLVHSIEILLIVQFL